jgi:hypothetical protein
MDSCYTHYGDMVELGSDSFGVSTYMVGWLVGWLAGWLAGQWDNCNGLSSFARISKR